MPSLEDPVALCHLPDKQSRQIYVLFDVMLGRMIAKHGKIKDLDQRLTRRKFSTSSLIF